MNALDTPLRSSEPNRPAWRPGGWTLSLAIGWLALLAALMLIATSDLPEGDPVIDTVVTPII